MPQILALNKVCRSFPGFALSDVSFSIEPGSVMGLLGPNGAGKTTIIKLILNLLHLHGGSISVFGLDIGSHEVEIKKKVSYVAEAAQLPPHASARWLEELLSICYPTWDSALYRQYLGSFGVPADKPARALSKGTVVKLALAGALAHRPRLLILDEPTSGLDPIVRYEVVNVVRDLARKEGAAVLFSTHIVSDLELAADWVTVLCDGRVVTSETKDRLLGRWRRLTFAVTGGGSGATRTALPGNLLEARQDGEVMRAVTGSFTPELLEDLRRSSKGEVGVETLGLEEVFRYLVRANGVGHSNRT